MTSPSVLTQAHERSIAAAQDTNGEVLPRGGDSGLAAPGDRGHPELLQPPRQAALLPAAGLEAEGIRPEAQGALGGVAVGPPAHQVFGDLVSPPAVRRRCDVSCW